MEKKILITVIWTILISMSSSMYSQIRTVGEEVMIQYESEHPYPTSSKTNEIVWSQEISYTEKTATYIAVHFNQLSLAAGDKLVLRSPNNERVWEYTSEDNDRGEFWSIPIYGDKAIIEIISSNSVQSFGYRIDKIARGFTQSEVQSVNGIESICGEDDTEEAKCYQNSEPVVYENSRAVARLLRNGIQHCTGFLVGSEGHLMTCEHCIEDQNTANNISVEMMAEGSDCSVNCQSPLACPGTIVADEVELVQNNADLDYALVMLATNVSREHGFWTMREEGATIDDQIYIPQHPAGSGKRIAFVSDNSNDSDGFVHVQSNTFTANNRVTYFGDTQGGSSGSPVISYEDHCVVAVHGWGGCPNSGANTSMIIADLGANIPDNAICGQVACFSYDDIHIFEDEIYNLDIEFSGNIIVHAGAILIINAPISFGPGSGIYIYSEGKVFLNSTLTACDRWNGIRVFENAEFVSRPGSVIEHAVWGVSSTEWGEFLGTGTIRCEGTTFRNNAVAAMIATNNAVEIERKPYYAQFSDCAFINNDEMRHEKFWAFVTSYNVKGLVDWLPAVQVYNCVFRDAQTNSTYPTKWNSGIVALNGDVYVGYSTFLSLYSGIEARSGLADNPWLWVRSCDFRDCGYSAINSGISGSTFQQNTFSFGILPMETENGEQVGVLLQDQMNDTYFQGNIFKFDPIIGYPGYDPLFFKWSIGTYVNSIGASKTNLIRKNYYTNVDYPNVALGNNANFENGLHYLCNLNASNEFDFIMANGYALRDEQGLASVNNIFLPSGNTFSHTNWDFLNFGLNKPNYYHDESDDAQIPGGIMGNTGNYFGIELKARKSDDHCSKEKDREELKTEAEAIQNEQDYNSYWSSSQIALEAYNNAKNSENAELTKTKKVRLTYESDQLGRVVALGYDYARKQSSRTEIRKWIRRFNNVTGDYLLVGDYFSTGEYEQGLKVLSEMTFKRQLSEKEMIDLDKVAHIYQTIADDGLDNLDNSFITDLESYAESKEGKSCFLARTILRNYGQYYAPIVDIPTAVGKEQSTEEYGTSLTMSVSPNPTDYHITFDWLEFDALGKEVHIKITNQMGMLIDVLRPGIGNTSIDWTTENVSGSSCHYGLFIDGQEADSGQIIINK